MSEQTIAVAVAAELRRLGHTVEVIVEEILGDTTFRIDNGPELYFTQFLRKAGEIIDREKQK